MIHRANYLAVRAFLADRREIWQRDPQTIACYYQRLRYLLAWADETPFAKSGNLRPVFPQHVLTLRTAAGMPLKPSVVRKICHTAQTFFDWLRDQNPATARYISSGWIKTLAPPRMAPILPPERRVVTLEMVRQMLAVVPTTNGEDVFSGSNDPIKESITLQREKAAAAFLFLSGARPGAFVTLTLDCINMAARTVRQDPAWGVRTKLKKAAITCLLEIPDLIAVVTDWDAYLRAHLPGSACWYPILHSDLGQIAFSDAPPGKYRRARLAANMKMLFCAAGLEPLSPNKFRHGHAVHALKLARDVSELKAISMNLMHESLTITDQVYAVLSGPDVHERIARLGQSPKESPRDMNDIKAALREVLGQYIPLDSTTD